MNKSYRMIHVTVGSSTNSGLSFRYELYSGYVFAWLWTEKYDSSSLMVVEMSSHFIVQNIIYIPIVINWIKWCIYVELFDWFVYRYSSILFIQMNIRWSMVVFFRLKEMDTINDKDEIDDLANRIRKLWPRQTQDRVIYSISFEWLECCQHFYNCNNQLISAGYCNRSVRVSSRLSDRDPDRAADHSADVQQWLLLACYNRCCIRCTILSQLVQDD